MIACKMEIKFSTLINPFHIDILLMNARNKCILIQINHSAIILVIVCFMWYTMYFFVHLLFCYASVVPLHSLEGNVINWKQFLDEKVVALLFVRWNKKTVFDRWNKNNHFHFRTQYVDDVSKEVNDIIKQILRS